VYTSLELLRFDGRKDHGILAVFLLARLANGGKMAM